MLAVAITFEAVAFAAIFGLGGPILGLSILLLAALLVGASVLPDRREARPAHVHRVWTYFVLNETLRGRAYARQRVAPGLSYPDGSLETPPGTVLHDQRWRRSTGRN
jgi:hypothetical protein